MFWRVGFWRWDVYAPGLLSAEKLWIRDVLKALPFFSFMNYYENIYTSLRAQTLFWNLLFWFFGIVSLCTQSTVEVLKKKLFKARCLKKRQNGIMFTWARFQKIEDFSNSNCLTLLAFQTSKGNTFFSYSKVLYTPVKNSWI